MKHLKTVVIGFTLLLLGCVSVGAKDLTPLEIQSMQTREYPQSMDVIFPSVVSVFQDLGYMIKSADKSSGFINAESPASTHTVFLGGRDVSQTSATAFLERIGNNTRVRLSFVIVKLTYIMSEQKRNDTPIHDVAVYANAFERIENGIFVRTATP